MDNFFWIKITPLIDFNFCPEKLNCDRRALWISAQIYQLTIYHYNINSKCFRILPDVWVFRQWMGIQLWEHRLLRNRLCTFPIRCQRQEQQHLRHTSWKVKKSLLLISELFDGWKACDRLLKKWAAFIRCHACFRLFIPQNEKAAHSTLWAHKNKHSTQKQNKTKKNFPHVASFSPVQRDPPLPPPPFGVIRFDPHLLHLCFRECLYIGMLHYESTLDSDVVDADLFSFCFKCLCSDYRTYKIFIIN